MALILIRERVFLQLKPYSYHQMSHGFIALWSTEATGNRELVSVCLCDSCSGFCLKDLM